MSDENKLDISTESNKNTKESAGIHLDALKNEMLKNISEIEFRDFFAKAAKCSENNARILLIVKPETYDRIAKTPFLNQEYFAFLVEIMKDKIHENIELVVRMPKSDKGDEGELDSITLGEELDLDDLDDFDLDDLEGFDEEDETKSLTFLSSKKLKMLLVLEYKEDYLCMRKWALSRAKDLKEKIKILSLDKNGIEELFEEEYHRVLEKSVKQKKSLITLGADKNSENFQKFSEVMISLKRNMSPNESEANSFIDFILADEDLFVKDGAFNLKAFETIPSFIIKNFSPLTQKIKESIEDKDETFDAQIETIKTIITGIDDDKDLSFFLLSEIVKDLSFTMIKKLYLSNAVVEKYINENFEDFEDIMSIIVNPADANMANLRLAIKDMLIPYLNKGWSSIED